MTTQFLYPARFDSGLNDWFVYFEDYPVVKTSFNINTFGEPRIAEVTSLYAEEYVNSNTFNEADVTTSITLIADNYTNANTFYEPDIRLVFNIYADLVVNSNTFNQQAVSVGPVDLYTEILNNTTTFGVPVLLSNYRVNPSSVANVNLFNEIFITVGVANLTPAQYINNTTFYQATRQSSYNATAELFTNVNQFYSYNLVSLIKPNVISNTNQIFNAELTVGETTLSPTLFSNINLFNIHKIYETYFDFAPRKSSANINVAVRKNLATSSRKPNLSIARR
jgi:hypothetical protein